MMGIGAITAAIVAFKQLPKIAKSTSSKVTDEELYRFRRFVRRCMAEIERNDITVAGRTALPKNLDNLADLMSKKYPVLGNSDRVKEFITDLMENHMIQFATYSDDEVPILKTITWDESLIRKDYEEPIRTDGTRYDLPPMTGQP